jgi:cytochrome c553
MNLLSRIAILAGAAALACACSPIDRSRAINDPGVPALTLAQQVCSSCHGLTGVSTSPEFPKLAGQQRDYLVAQLSEFKSHNRADPDGVKYMWGLGRLSPDQVQGLADYFSSQTPSIGPVIDAALIGEGRRIYNEGIPDHNVPMCSACHGAKGEGAGQFPRLAGQHADYVAKQLLIYQRTDQRPLGVAMKQVTHELTAQQIKALAAFLQSFAAVKS